MISLDELNSLVDADESDTLERKASLADTDAIRNTLIAFANDLAGRGGGKIIIGQNPDKTIAGISVGADEAQQTISNLARNRCRPSIPVIIDIYEHHAKRIAVVDVKASLARPHFRGDCYVRQGSTNRVATDAEIMVLHSAAVDPKVRQLLTWQQEGKTTLTCVQLPTGMWGLISAELAEINGTYIVLRHSPSFSMTVPLEDLRLGYDYQRKQPQVTFQRHH
ncbi:MAG TPA: ATP-binding protein [Acidobacteriaceae bacterium]|nr:ATP-binding protein [Acidobacteriaceae bacterium]